MYIAMALSTAITAVVIEVACIPTVHHPTAIQTVSQKVRQVLQLYGLNCNHAGIMSCFSTAIHVNQRMRNEVAMPVNNSISNIWLNNQVFIISRIISHESEMFGEVMYSALLCKVSYQLSVCLP